MIPVGDERHGKFIRGQLFPQGIVVAMYRARDAVSEVGGQPRPGGNRLTNPPGIRRRVSQGRNNAGIRQRPNEIQGPGTFRRQCDHTDEAGGGVLPAKEILDVGIAYRGPGMGAPGPLLRRKKGAFHMNSANRPGDNRVLVAEPDNPPDALKHDFGVGGDYGGQMPGGAVLGQKPAKPFHRLRFGGIGVVVHPRPPVDLDIEPSRGGP